MEILQRLNVELRQIAYSFIYRRRAQPKGNEKRLRVAESILQKYLVKRCNLNKGNNIQTFVIEFQAILKEVNKPEEVV